MAPKSAGVTARVASLAIYRRVLVLKWHGGWVSRPHFRVLEARALLVCHRRMFGNSRDGFTTLENLRSTIQGHRDGHTTTHSPQSQATTCRPLCPWMADRPHVEGRSANKERTPLPRAGWSCVSPSQASHPQVFHGGCFGVYGTPPREAVWFCEIGTKIPLVPRLGIRTVRIRWLSRLTFGWRVQTCSQVIAWYLKTAPPGVCLAA